MATNRFFQDDAWRTGHLDGCSVEKLVGDDALVFLKPRDRAWQRFYLDAGLGFWQETEEPEDQPRVDFGARFGVVGQRIGRIRCEPGPRIRVEIGEGELVLDGDGVRFA
ncbi:MAG TPA: hypothetical protein VEK11_21095 [Thermoanaerobaculia bacterium]|nr:hypothetical protein [Thermoanaerobaculia bacterium]